MDFIKQIKKTIAISVSISLLCTVIFNDIAYSNMVACSTLLTEKTNSFIPILFGSISKAKYYNSDEIVINIQDLHCHAQTQRQISSIIGYLEKEYNIKEVYLEGAYKNINTTWLSNFTNTKIGKSVIENLVDDGKINGTEYYSLINTKNNFIKPIEDEKLYKENISLLNEIIKLKNEIDVVCDELENQIKVLKKDYSNLKIQSLDTLINKFKNKKITPKKYYSKLIKKAKENNIDINKYPNIKIYTKLLDDKNITNEKEIAKEMNIFFTKIKGKISYKEYVKLLSKSNNFKNIENIKDEIKFFNEKYGITKILNLNYFESFINYLDFNANVNAVDFVEEEEKLKEEMLFLLGKTKYEIEISFLNEFIPKIREYFTANISAKEYSKFETQYAKFRKIWPSYFEINTVKKLDKYKNLLSKYHENNLKRDNEFLKKLALTLNVKVNNIIGDTILAQQNILKEINSKKIKVVVTGGFHTQGLENILENKKISYVVITPKITQPVEKAKEIYINTIEYNSNILKNTINIEPLSQEPINVSFPKIMASIFSMIETSKFKQYSKDEILLGVRDFVKNEIIDKQDNDNIKIKDWNIEENLKDKVVFSVEYEDNGILVKKEYLYSHGIITLFSKIENDTQNENVSNKIELLSILKNIVKTTNKKVDVIINTLIAPILEEIIFRIVPSLPLLITTVPIATNPILLIPTIITFMTGTLIFSYTHALVDKLSNINKKEIRIWKQMLPQSVILTGIYLGLLLLFPEQVVVAPIVVVMLHSLNNILVTIKDKIKNKRINNILSKLKLLVVFKTQNELKQLVLENPDELLDSYISCIDSFQVDDGSSNIGPYENFQKKYGFASFANALKICFMESKQTFNAVLNYCVDKYFPYYGLWGEDDYLIDAAFVPFSSPLSYDNLQKFENDLIEKINLNKEQLSKKVKDFNYWINFFFEINDDYATNIGYSILRALYKTGLQTESPNLKSREFGSYSWTEEFKRVCLESQNTIEQDLSDEYNLNTIISQLKYIKNDYLKYLLSIKNGNVYGIRKIFLEHLNEMVTLLQNNQENLQNIIDKLENCKSLPKKQQIDIMQSQLNDFCDIVFNTTIVDTAILKEMMIPLYLTKSMKDNNKSLLEYYLTKLVTNEQFIKSDVTQYSGSPSYDFQRNLFFNLISISAYIYKNNQANGLFYIKNIFSIHNLNNIVFNSVLDFDLSVPKSLEEAKEKLPKEFKGKDYSYEELENLYFAFGLQFELYDEESENYDRLFYVSEKQKLLNRIQIHIFPKILQSIVNKINNSKFYFRTVKNHGRTQYTINPFESLENVLKYNELALQELNKCSEESIQYSMKYVQLMIEAFTSLDGHLGRQAQNALNKIRKNIENGTISIDNMLDLTSWNKDNIDNILTLHTLINAVHQSSINLLINTENIGNEINKMYFKNCNKYLARIINYSNNPISLKMQDFLYNLSLSSEIYSYEDLSLVYNNKLFCSKKIGVHSLDLFVDLDKGINVTFNDSANGDGNKLRVLLFATLFAQVGFDITNVELDNNNGVANFSANFELPESLDRIEQYANAFAKALQIVSKTTNLDYRLEDNYDGKTIFDFVEGKHMTGVFIIPKMTLEDFKKIKNTRVMPEQFRVTSPYRIYKAPKKLIEEWNKFIEDIKQMDSKIEEQEKEYKQLCEYFGIQSDDSCSILNIVREYVIGKLIINKEAVLVRNENYDGIGDFVEIIELNFSNRNRGKKDIFAKAQLLNLIDSENFYFKEEGFIGNMIYETGIIKISNDNFLSIRAICDKERKRLKVAEVELVDFEGNRKVLSYDELLDILKKTGYSVKWQPERNSREIEKTYEELKKELSIFTTAIYSRGEGISGKQNGYIPLKVTYDENSIEENSLWITPYIKPENISTIEQCGGILMTGTGSLSHASITAKEKGKIAILSKGTWQKDGKFSVSYYKQEAENLNINIQGQKYHTAKINSYTTTLEEGDIVLANGITGRMLVFRNIDNVDALQQLINDNDVVGIKKYIKEYEDGNIEEVIEYIFFQTVWQESKKDIVDILLNWKENKKIIEKVQELNKNNIEESIVNIRKGLQNIDNIEKESISLYGELVEEKINIELAIIETLKKEIVTLKSLSSEESKEIGRLRSIILKKEKDLIKQIELNIKNIMNTIDKLLLKQFLTDEEKDLLAKISKKAKVLHYYWHYDGMEEKILEVDEKLKDVFVLESTEYRNEISGFENISDKDVLKFGGKTTELAVISNVFKHKNITKVKVPYGIGISKNVLEIFFANAGKLEEYKILLSEFEKAILENDEVKACSIGEKIRKMIQETDDSVLKEFIESKIDKNNKYAVRSSGVGEDGANHAFAGMAKTKLNVTSENVYFNLKECWQSFYSRTCIVDMLAEKAIVRPAILVQEMVPEVKQAGVCFSRVGIGNLVEEIVRGYGEGLVSGDIEPDHIVVQPGTDLQYEYTRALDVKTKITKSKDGDGLDVVELQQEDVLDRIIGVDVIAELRDIIEILEHDSQYPVDVEYAIDENENIYVLQRRAITTFILDEKLSYQNIEHKYNVSLEYSTKYSNSDVIAYIPNPNENFEEAIPVYFGKKEGQNITLIIDAKYKNIDVTKIILEKINDDSVVRNKISKKIFESIKEGDFGLLPSQDQIYPENIIDDTEIKYDNINILLSCA